MFLGTIVAFGTTSIWQISFLLLMIGQMQSGMLKVSVNRWVFLLIVSLYIPYIFTPHNSYATVYAANILMIWWNRHNLKFTQWYWLPIFLMSLVNLGVAVHEFSEGMTRVTGMTENASTLGLSGMSVFPIGAVTVGLSLSRTALFGVGLIFITRPTKATLLGMIVAASLAFGLGMHYTPERFKFSGVRQSADLRIDTIDGSSTESVGTIIEVTPTPGPTVTPGTPVPTPTIVKIKVKKSDLSRRFVWHGFGFGNYFQTTKIAIPHNVFILTFWELGIFAIPFWISLAVLWWRSGHSIRLLIVVVITGSIDPEFLTRIEGVYITLALHTLCTRWNGKLPLKFDRMAVGQFDWVERLRRVVRVRGLSRPADHERQ